MVLDIFFLGTDSKSGKEVLAKITREVYITDNLAIKLLIRTNVIVLENINIMISKKLRYIRSYSTNILVEVLQKKGVPKSLVYVIIRLIILVFASIVILVYYLVVIEDRDLLFEPNKILVTLFI